MRKFLFLVFIFLLTACTNNVNKHEFVNPVFNQPLRPFSNRDGITYLTPTSIKSMTPLDKNLVGMTGQCDLLENDKDHITLSCDLSWRNHNRIDKNTTTTYIIEGLYHSKCLSIIEKYKMESDSDYVATSYYCVTPPADYSEDN